MRSLVCLFRPFPHHCHRQKDTERSVKYSRLLSLTKNMLSILNSLVYSVLAISATFNFSVITAALILRTVLKLHALLLTPCNSQSRLSHCQSCSKCCRGHASHLAIAADCAHPSWPHPCCRITRSSSRKSVPNWSCLCL